MKPSLTVKVWILVGYVVLCTILVLTDNPEPIVAQPGAIKAQAVPAPGD